MWSMVGSQRACTLGAARFAVVVVSVTTKLQGVPCDLKKREGRGTGSVEKRISGIGCVLVLEATCIQL